MQYRRDRKPRASSHLSGVFLMSFRKASNREYATVPDSWVNAQSYSFRKRGLKVVSLSFTTNSKKEEIVSCSTLSGRDYESLGD